MVSRRLKFLRDGLWSFAVETGQMGTLPVAGENPDKSQYLLYSLLGKDPVFEEAVQVCFFEAILGGFLSANLRKFVCDFEGQCCRFLRLLFFVDSFNLCVTCDWSKRGRTKLVD